MRVLQTSNKWGVNCNTFKFVSMLDRDEFYRNHAEILVPDYIWRSKGALSDIIEHGDGVDSPSYYIEKEAISFGLKDWGVTMHSYGSNVRISWSDRTLGGAQVSLWMKVFIDRHSATGLGDIINFELSDSDSALDSNKELYQMKTKCDIYYSVITDLQSGCEMPPFRFMPYGLAPRQMNIVYKNKTLGSSYVILFGYWGILLGDDLSFDSIVAFDANTIKSIEVTKFIRTVNPFVVKTLVMMG